MLEITTENFDKEVKHRQGPVIVDFWAPWCGPCKALGPVFEKMSSDYTGKLAFAKLNVDDNAALAQQNDVMGIPCLIVYNRGVEVDRFVGAFPEPSLRKKIDATLAKVA